MADMLMGDLRICTDCAMYSANRDVQDGDGNDITAEHGERIREAWDGWADVTTGRFPELVLDYPEDEDAGPDAGFSTMPCDGCDSPLGGDRFHAVLIG